VKTAIASQIHDNLADLALLPGQSDNRAASCRSFPGNFERSDKC
jgi:hypothetical protein